ncbi:MAG: dicarboxylate/amino acid:cation symporter [Gammaproteobacteria bacterium]|nr:dicarboxylate/amino acid:cation symporter [Gammaproteobacteria bacterium]
MATNSLLSSLTKLNPRSLVYLADYLQGMVKGRLWLKVLIGMFLGLLTGFLLGPSVGWLEPDTASVIGNWLALPGQLFLTLVQMIVIPLVFASVIRGIAASENPDALKSTGVRVVLFFVVTTVIAIVIGIVLALTIKPGNFVSSEMVTSALGAQTQLPDEDSLTAPRFAEIPEKLVTLLPSNPLNSMVQNNMLQVVLFALVVGVALVAMKPVQSKPMLELLGSLQEVCMTVVRFAMRLAPFAVFGLMAQLTSKIGLGALLGLAVYVGTVLAGLLIMLALYLVLVWVIASFPPKVFVKSVREVLLLAFSTSSSAAVMPLSIKTAEEALQVRPSISQLVIPLGATINMNGTALYQGVAAIFLAQVFGVDISLGGMVLIVVLAVGASIGSPATPGVGIIILATILSSVGIPPAGIALIMGVDRILDMCRTAVNVCGDLVASVLMHRWVKGETTVPIAENV